MATTKVERRQLAKIRPETEYYEHQKEGVRQMFKMGNCLLADEMGLGKSLQALTVAAIDFEDRGAANVLVVSPASLKWNWLNEINQHTTFSATVLNGTPATRKKQLAEFPTAANEILICNYEQVTSHISDLNHIGFNDVILDEAHYIKSPKAKRTRACQGLIADRFMLLTGSPLLNQVNELWSLLRRIDPNNWPNYYAFLNRYAMFGGYKDKQIVGVKNKKELTERLQTVMIRRLKKNVLDLPEKQIIPVWCDLYPQQRKVYDEAADQLKITIPNQPKPMEIENILTRFLRLKQICGTLATIGDGDLGDVSGKLDAVIEKVLNDLSGQHIVLFTQFRGVLACLSRRLRERDIPVYELHGDVPMDRRFHTVQKWEQDKPGALVCQINVAGVGLNLTRARTALFVDKLFTPKMNEQAQDRLHRIGADKTQPIQILEFMCKDTVEQRIEQILKTKTKLFKDLVEGHPDLKKKLIEELKKTL